MTDDVWRIEAYFVHLTPASVFDETQSTKPGAYKRVADFLMSEGIVEIIVRKNGEIQQRIKVDDQDELAWEATLASPEGQAALERRAAQLRQEIEAGEYEEGGFDGL